MLLSKLALLLLPPTLFAAELFRNITFDEALAAAASEKKIVMIDFFTTWCGPCKKLDATTWKDARVLEWADKKCVAIKLDAEKEVALAKRYRIEIYPTMLILKADGTEIDRIVGFKDAPEFLSEVEDALAGKDSLTRARAKLEGREKDPMARQDYARALAQAGKKEEALQEFLWCFDHGLESPGYGGVRRTFLLGDIHRLGKAAVKALEERRDAAETRLLENPADFESGMDFVSINRTLRAAKRTLSAYDRLKKEGKIDSKLRIAFERELLPLLVADRRYQDAMELIGDPKAEVDNKIAMFAQMQRLDDGDESMKEEMAQAQAAMKGNTVNDCARVYEACMGVGRRDDAAQIADKIVAFAPNGFTWAALVTNAARAGAEDVARSLAERGLAALPEKEQKPVRKALEKIESPKVEKPK